MELDSTVMLQSGISRISFFHLSTTCFVVSSLSSFKYAVREALLPPRDNPLPPYVTI